MSSDIKELFLACKTRQDIASLLGLQDSQLRSFLYSKKIKSEYRSFFIRKRNGKKRFITTPPASLKKVQQTLVAILENIYEPLPCSHGFIKGRNIISNATPHINKKYVLNIDLKDFFSQIHFGRIVGMFSAPPFSLGRQASQTIAQLVCLDGSLPQGAPTSPILSNMVCSYLDKAMMNFAKKKCCTYTRYADDITFSTDNFFPSSIAKIRNGEIILGEKLLNILHRNTFEINPNKTALRSKYNRQEVTGLIVNQFPNVPRRFIKELRAILHYCSTIGLYATALEYIKKGGSKNNRNIDKIKSLSENDVTEWFRKVIIGKIYFIKQVKGEKSFTYLNLAKKYNTCIEEFFDITQLLSLTQLINQNLYVICTNDESVQGSCFNLDSLGLVTSFHLVDSLLNNDDLTLRESLKFKNFDTERWTTIIDDVVCYNKDIDYILFKTSTPSKNAFKSGDSKSLVIGDLVSIAGFPEYNQHNTPTITKDTQITSLINYLGAALYTVNTRIVHGSSGGVVLNQNREVIGIIKAGRAGNEDENTTSKHGFVPIHLVLDDIQEQTKNSTQQS